MRWGLVVGIALATTSPCLADDKADCVAAYSNAQDLRQETKLVAAKEQLTVCERSVCPRFIAHDCTTWMAEVEASIPTVVFAAKDADGRDVTDASVLVDGKTIAERLDGTAVAVDPGAHAVEFRRDGYAAISNDAVVRMGEKNREIVVTFPRIETAPPTVVAVNPPPINRPLAPVVIVARRSEGHPLVTTAVVIGGAGIAGVVTGVITGIVAIATKNARCKMDVCEAGTLSTLWSESTVSTTSIIAGGVLLAAGVVFFFLGHKKDHGAASLTHDFVYRF